MSGSGEIHQSSVLEVKPSHTLTMKSRTQNARVHQSIACCFQPFESLGCSEQLRNIERGRVPSHHFRQMLSNEAFGKIAKEKSTVLQKKTNCSRSDMPCSGIIHPWYTQLQSASICQCAAVISIADVSPTYFGSSHKEIGTHLWSTVPVTNARKCICPMVLWVSFATMPRRLCVCVYFF